MWPNSSDHCTNLHTNEAQFIPLGNTLTTNNITDIIDTTNTPEIFTSIAAIGGGVAAALVVLILIIIVIVVLILVVSKSRTEKTYQEHQGKF